MAPHSEAAAANLAFALLSADGVPRDVSRARALFASVAASGETELQGYAHNWLGHIASGKFGGRRSPADALAHFEQAAMAGHGEATFNAGLMHDEGHGVPPSADKACDFYRRRVELGHVSSMTNLAAKIIKHDLGAAMDLCERAAEAGDGKAAALLQALTEAGMAVAIEGGLAAADNGDMPPAIRVMPAGIGRPQAIAAALQEGIQAPRKEAENITAYMLGFGSWRELARAARKGKADPPDEECGPEEVRRRRTYQTHMLTLCVDMGPQPRSPSRRSSRRPRHPRQRWMRPRWPACRPHHTCMPTRKPARISTGRTTRAGLLTTKAISPTRRTSSRTCSAPVRRATPWA